MQFDHVGIVVGSLKMSRRFYLACLEPLGISLLQDNSITDTEGWLVFGTSSESPFFVVSAGRPSFWRDEHLLGVSPMHIALSAKSIKAVDLFHSAGVANGGTNNGSPGERPSTTPYYAAYLLDPEGNNIEAGFRGAI